MQSQYSRWSKPLCDFYWFYSIFYSILDAARYTSWSRKVRFLANSRRLKRHYPMSVGRKSQDWEQTMGGIHIQWISSHYLKGQHIHHEMTVPHTHQQNGVAERKNRTLIEAARCMLSHAKLPKMYWAKAVSTSVLKKETPYQRWSGKKPNMSHMRVFGYVVYAHVPDTERGKLDKRAVKLCFMGYAKRATVCGMRQRGGFSSVRMSYSMNQTLAGNRKWKNPVQRMKYQYRWTGNTSWQGHCPWIC